MKFLVALSLAAAMCWSVQGAYGAASVGGTTTYRNIGTGGTGVGTSVPGIGSGVIEDDPRALHEAYKKKAENDYKDAAKALAAGDMETAVRLFIRVVEMSKTRVDSPYPGMAYEQLGAIVEQAEKELEVARQLVAGEDPAAGLLELKRIARVYMGLNPAKTAATLVRQLEVDPAFQATLRAGRLKVDLQRAAALETEAETLGRTPGPAGGSL